MKAAQRISMVIILLIAGMGSVLVGTVATVIEVLAPPHYEIAFGEPGLVTANSWIVFDAETGEVLASRNAETSLPIASLTKLGTAAVVVADERLFATTTVTWGDLQTEGRAGRLRPNSEYRLHTLLFPLLLESSNDAATTLARTDASLVTEMNDLVHRLGLTKTVFADASGLSPHNVSTAHELSALLKEVYVHRRHLLDITRLPSYVTVHDGWLNNNPFIAIPEYLGGKHGFTDAARHTAVGVFNEQFLGGTRPIGYVLLASDNLTEDMALLRAYVGSYVSYR